MLMEPISISLCALINQLFQRSEALSQSGPAGRLGARARELFLIGTRPAAVCQSWLTFPRPKRKQRVSKAKAVAAISCHSDHEGGNVGNEGEGVSFPEPEGS